MKQKLKLIKHGLEDKEIKKEADLGLVKNQYVSSLKFELKRHQCKRDQACREKRNGKTAEGGGSIGVVGSIGDIGLVGSFLLVTCRKRKCKGEAKCYTKQKAE